MNPIIEAEDLFFSYQNTSVLSNVSFKVFPGEFIGLIGPNGGGKTTLLKLILGFLKPTKGKLRIFDKSPNIHLDSQCLSYVPQSVRFDRQFPISVLEVVLSGLLNKLPWYGRFSPKEKHSAFDALEQVGLVNFADRAFGTLSGGQAQRVLIARALVSNPQVLLLDEPTASVDSKAEADIYAILKQLKGKMTILMVTHDLNAAIDQVQRLFCVQGNVISLEPEEVCQHFALGLYHAPLIQNFPRKE
ncbi:MAG: metal ABC transporter ATP-binding protein [Parachlamydiaceae bacterium]|nr:metal ABC transporter ATP-binding protein [Parachlamydiaceae bacterium]